MSRGQNRLNEQDSIKIYESLQSLNEVEVDLQIKDGYPIVYNCSDKSPIIIPPPANKWVDIALFAKVIDDRLQGTLLTCI